MTLDIHETTKTSAFATPHSRPTQTQPVPSQQLLLSDRTYYRSKIFNAPLGINPLIAAASPLFTLANQLHLSTTSTDTFTLYQHLQHEIRAFEQNAQAQHYRSETILMARYLLCSLLDELILTSAWGMKSNWHQQRLLWYFHQEHEGNERFFIILERLSADPHVHIDLLELIYLCLSTGYMGKYRDFTDGKIALSQLMERLFTCIRLQRGELKPDLNVTPTENPQPVVNRFHLPLWLIISFTIAILLTIYSSFSYMLSNTAQNVYQQVNPLNHQIYNADT